MLGKDDFVGGWIPVRIGDYARQATVRMGISMAILAGFVGSIVFAVRYVEHRKEERLGGSECYPLWEAAREKINDMRAEEEKLGKTLGPNSFREEALNARAEKIFTLEQGFRDKGREWMACMAKKQQKNSPVAVQPRQVQPLQRARNAL